MIVQHQPQCHRYALSRVAKQALNRALPYNNHRYVMRVPRNVASAWQRHVSKPAAAPQRK